MFGFPDYEHESYKRNLLNTVIFQVKYPLNDEVIRNKDAFLTENLNKLFPIKKDILAGKAVLKLEADKTPILQSSEPSSMGIEFRTQDNKKAISVTKDAFTCTTVGAAYTNYQDAIQEFKETYIPLLKQLNVKTVNRVAVRKINMLEVADDAKEEINELLSIVFNESLISNFLSVPSSSALFSGVNSIVFKEGDFQLNLNYGMTVTRDELGRRIILDIDLFNKNNSNDIENLINELTVLNKELYNVFRWSFKDNLVQGLNK